MVQRSYPSKIAFVLSAFLVTALALTYRYGLYLPVKREKITLRADKQSRTLTDSYQRK
ncbi:hypothetical protein ALQ08_104382 [Pseudomonas syringae pv. delphinii]|uniref:Uncharacterized protein n=1 Tax=Pseudomonas syringae pv. delphinii TaxID=192088 RepID=A0A3M4JSC8_9PSED|nr:Unknown protein sequence [Pseudomonas syringae pv. maculicola]RMN24077.1 hypothetical protein ALQ62_101408 [Pseudomonas coronafaciens pv. zizaniae]RMQ19826.1 hypothetical protein ALQ08_104382 [Pseudomonas syringae pv. delphinii]